VQEATVTIAIEPRGLSEVRPPVYPDDPDVEGAMFSIAALPVEEADSDPDVLELVTTEREGEDDIGLWFG
jgi:hypothetical protein